MKEWDSEMGVKTVNQFCSPGCAGRFGLPTRRFRPKDMITVCVSARALRLGSNAGVSSWAAVRAGIPPASAVLDSHVFAQNDSRPYCQKAGSA